jgi:hypothetical protein
LGLKASDSIEEEDVRQKDKIKYSKGSASSTPYVNLHILLEASVCEAVEEMDRDIRKQHKRLVYICRDEVATYW